MNTRKFEISSMVQTRQSREFQDVPSLSSPNHSGINEDPDEAETTQANTDNPLTDEEDEDTTNSTIADEKRLKSNVWKHAKKISMDQAQCSICKMYIKTIRSGTTTLRKHLIHKHKLTHLMSRATLKSEKIVSIPRERKIRLDHLANLAIFEDGRSFGDLRKNGIRKFLSEAISGMLGKDLLIKYIDRRLVKRDESSYCVIVYLLWSL